MKITPLIFMIFSCFFATAQIKNFAVSISPNYSAIKGSTEYVEVESYFPDTYPNPTTSTYGVKQSFSSKIGLDVNTKLDYSISRRFFISTGLSGNYMRFDRDQEVMLRYIGTQPQNDNTSGIPFGTFYGFDSSVKRDGAVTLGTPRHDNTTLYISMPVMMGMSFFNDKLLIRAGATLSYLLDATRYTMQYSLDTHVSNEYKEHSTKGYHSFLAGAIVQSTYRITKHLGFDISYQHSLTPIYTENKSRYNTFTAGISYNLGF
jgi:hypothetical protein